MNISCSICLQLLTPSSDIVATPCGHVFHFPCLIQWLETHPSCPECRQKVKRNAITRIYFNYLTEDNVRVDSVTLQCELDSLKHHINVKTMEADNCKQMNVTLKKQNIGLREEIKKCESQVNEKNNVIHALKQQITHFKDKCTDYDNVKQEKMKLQSKIATYENVVQLLRSTSEDVDQIINQTRDVTTLSTYVAIMKRELNTCVNKRKELRNTVKRLQQDIQSIKMKNNDLTSDVARQREQLEEELAICRSERDALQQQLNHLTSDDIPSNECRESTDLSKSVENVSSRKRDSDLIFDLDAVPQKKLKVYSRNKDNSDLPTRKKENAENSPYLPTKSKSVLALKEHTSQRSGLWIAPKRSLLSSKTKSDSSLKNSSNRDRDTSIDFDGFGGHSKVETFPKTSLTKKRPANDTSRQKKIKLDLTNNKHLDGYIINLT